jgi:hypothetical protein
MFLLFIWLVTTCHKSKCVNRRNKFITETIPISTTITYRSHHIDYGCLIRFFFVVRASLFRHQRPQFIEVDCRTPIFLLGQVEMAHTDFTEVTWVTTQTQKYSIQHSDIKNAISKWIFKLVAQFSELDCQQCWTSQYTEVFIWSTQIYTPLWQQVAIVGLVCDKFVKISSSTDYILCFKTHKFYNI